MIEAPTRIEATNVEGFATQIAQAYASAPKEPLTVNMSGVDAITRPAGAFLANALLTQLDKANLDVVAPVRSPIPKLTYSGLGFAFAHREGPTSFTNLSPEELQLDRWKLPWSPGRQRVDIEPSGEPAGDEDPSFFARAHAVFVNPHAVARRQHRKGVPYRVQGWLNSVLPPRAIQPEFLDSLQELVYELVDNVAEHTCPDNRTEPLSLVQVSVARGGEPDARDRVWVVVLDTGPGILTTAAPKIDDETLSSHELMTGLLDGRFLQTHHRARGLGLPRVVRICKKWKDSQLDILTDDLRVRVTEDRIQPSQAAWKVHGTVILARFTTPPVARETMK